MSCIWTHDTATATAKAKASVFIYDAGQYMGFLFPDDSWNCWRVLSRSLDGTTVTECVEPMPEDWVPLDIGSIEEYPLLEYKRTSSTELMLRIPSWHIDVRLPAAPKGPERIVTAAAGITSKIK